MKQKNIIQLLELLSELDGLKNIQRLSPVKGRKLAENDAEHTWHTLMWFLLLEPFLEKKINSEKILKMILIHDLPEIYTGDIVAFSKNHTHTKKEHEGAKKIFKKFPKQINKKYLNLWKEFESNKTKEAKIAKALDKLQPLLQHTELEWKGWKWTKESIKVVEKNKRNHIEFNNTLLDIYEYLIKRAHKISK
ncbi:MAG: HD domain-containing protein [Candidatus Paceibacterota bacterium]